MLAGKTTLLKHLLENRQGLRVAVIVNDLGAVNVDAGAVKSLSLDAEKDKVVELSNGCMCCSLKTDLLEQIYQVCIFWCRWRKRRWCRWRNSRRRWCWCQC